MGFIMISRALLLALSCAYATALAPLAAAADDSDCALYLTGPGRTSAYDYSLNLLKGNFGYEGQHTCITYEAINQAYLDARNRIVVSQPKGEWKPEDYASVGELILDISINLARMYGLNYEEIEKGLPLIDTSRTLIREVCPPVFSHVECRAGKYRRLDGLCNNLQHPTWGATNAPFQRLIGPLFADGINSPRIAHTGRDLPLSRVVSRTMHPDEGFHDHAGTVMVIAWGQFMDHDYTLTGTPLDPINRNDPEECCKRPLHLKHPYCNEIRIPDDDYFYRLFGVKCIDFVRGFPSPRPGCRLGSRVPFNTLTGAIDGNTVYGVTDKFARKLRTGYGGLLRMNPVFKEYGLKDLLPLKLDIPDEGCTRPNKNMYCFEAGEIRVNEQLVLTVMHTLMAREHNRVAQGLAAVNPHWDDETLFQEARRINIAEIQHITYNEFLPILLGKDVMEKFGLVLEKEGYWDGYDHTVNPDVIASFASAAYRFGHSLLPTAVERWSKAHKFIASKRLSDLIRRPYDLYRAGVLDEYVMGLMNQVAQAMDDSITQEVTNHLFKKVGARFGMDLVSFNMQRGREFGIPGYMEFRKFCGLSGADSFQDLFGTMSNETVRKYETIFEHPIDVDLWSGGVSERPLPGSMLGPTFACIIATQFSYSRRGDRFWFELPNQPSSFTPEQLVEIRKSRLARIICDNTDIIDTVQLYPMVLPDHELNPRVPCRSGIIPSMDFSKWAEPTPFHGQAKQFVTDAYIPPKNDSDCEEPVENVKENRNDKNTENQTTDSNNSQQEVVASVEVKDGCNKSHLTIQNCTQDSAAANCSESHILDNDTVLKYVYKKDDKLNIPEKTKGHVKNTLRRRKRSVNNNVQKESVAESAPVIVNYKTSHPPKEREHLSERNTGNVIQSADLADFNIETLHENVNINKQIDELQNKYQSEYKNHPTPSPHSNESVEREGLDDSRGINKPYRERDESGERTDYRDDKQTPQGRELVREESDGRNLNDGKATYSTAPEDSSDSHESEESTYKKPENSRESQESDENKHNRDGRSDYRNVEDDSKESNEKEYKRTDSKSAYRNPEDDSRESGEKDDYRGIQKTAYQKEHTINSDSREKENNKNSGENNYNRDNDKSAYKNGKDESEESREKYDYKEEKPSYNKQHMTETDSREKDYFTHNVKSNLQRPQQNSNESEEEEEIIAIMTKKNRKPQDFKHDDYRNKGDIHSNVSLPLNIRDVDIGDFSYEKIQINDKGVVEPALDTHENYNIGSLPKNIPLPTPNTDLKIISEQYSIETTDFPLRDEINEDIRKQTHINDGEIKPVVEINTDSSESNDENSKESKTNNEDVSLETLLGVKDTSSDEQNEKITAPHEDKEKGDVKQQFERIPLNYKHDDKEQKKNENGDGPISLDTPSQANNIEEPYNPGTVDVFTPKDHRYDENLNIKFDDLTIKLPEIKLPKDILAYDYEEAPKPHRNEDKNFFHYSGEYNDDEQPRLEKKKKSKKEDDDHDSEFDLGYRGYYGDYKKDYYTEKDDKRDDDSEEEGNDDDDLYEKFVRERFGKKGVFEKRSEKFRDVRPIEENAELFNTLKQVLKKTEDINKEAEKSGDPNAGYMWTLEYGQKL